MVKENASIVLAASRVPFKRWFGIRKQGYFVHVKRMITLEVITLSGFHKFLQMFIGLRFTFNNKIRHSRRTHF